jgi:cation diffusion facilitator family transporter
MPHCAEDRRRTREVAVEHDQHRFPCVCSGGVVPVPAGCNAAPCCVLGRAHISDMGAPCVPRLACISRGMNWAAPPEKARVSAQRRTALVSVGAACLLIAIKLVAGIASSSLGLLAEAAHSGTDLAAALLTFFAVSVAVRPADRGHPFGHGKAQNLAALAEAGFLILVSLVIAGAAIARLAGWVEFEVDATWWAFAAISLVMVIDASRMLVSLRTARAHRSDALLANALHFGSDLVGTLAVLVGLIAAALGFPQGDSIAALFVAVLVVVAAGRLLSRNVDVLMDRSPLDAEEEARRAIETLDPPVELRRIRVREAGGSHFADVVIGVAPGAAVGQGHAAADRVEDALQARFPELDVVVHVEPRPGGGSVRERALEAALGVSHVRELHNLAVLDVDGRTEVSLHLKLPGDLELDRAHEIAEQVERAILAAVPEVEDVRTHLEPLAEAAAAQQVTIDAETVQRVVLQETGAEARDLRFVRTDEGIVAFLTLEVAGSEPLSDAHARASAVEERIREAVPEIADVVVHTEP